MLWTSALLVGLIGEATSCICCGMPPSFWRPCELGCMLVARPAPASACPSLHGRPNCTVSADTSYRIASDSHSRPAEGACSSSSCPARAGGHTPQQRWHARSREWSDGALRCAVPGLCPAATPPHWLSAWAPCHCPTGLDSFWQPAFQTLTCKCQTFGSSLSRLQQCAIHMQSATRALAGDMQ